MEYILIVLLVLASAFFSSSEISLFSLNKLRLEKLAEDGKKSAKVAKYLTDRPKITLSGILIGNNLVNIAASSITTLIVLRLFPGNSGLASTLATFAITVLILIFGEIAPKIFGKKKALSWACVVSYPLFVLAMILFLPVTLVVLGFINLISKLFHKKEDTPTMTEEELVTMIETAEEEDVLDEEQSDLLQSAMDFSDTTVEDILVPRINMEAFDIEDDYEEIMQLATATSYSRLVVYEGTVDHVIGVLSMNRLFRAVAKKQGGEVNIRTLLVEPYFVHKTMKLPALLSQMRSHQIQMAIVLDEYGGTMGIVTMEDILEEIVGDIWDETDDIETEIETTGEGIYHVDGLTNIYDFFSHIDMDERDFDSEYTTMGGWAIEMLDADPHVGDSFSYRNLYVIVTEMNENIVTGLSVQVKEEQEEEE